MTEVSTQFCIDLAREAGLMPLQGELEEAVERLVRMAQASALREAAGRIDACPWWEADDCADQLRKMADTRMPNADATGVRPATSHAVFEIKGEEVEQVTVWLEPSEAKGYLDGRRKRCPSGKYAVFERHDW